MTIAGTTLRHFSSEQRLYIEQGSLLAAQLEHKVEQALGVTALYDAYRHSYITSGPGIGKTHGVRSACAAHGVQPLLIQGVSSMNALAIQLATNVHALKGDEQMAVWIDDCDSLFMERQSLDVMKGALDADRHTFVWNKNLYHQISAFLGSSDEADQRKGHALKAFQPVGGVGVEIPTDQVRFIITSNRPLAAPRPPFKSTLKMNEAAVRDRCEYTQFDLDDKKSWGWLAHIVLTEKKIRDFQLRVTEKQYLLEWLWANWTKLPATSMRFVQALVTDMRNHANGYRDHWEMRLIQSGG